jgi:hypothetical protein
MVNDIALYCAVMSYLNTFAGPKGPGGKSARFERALEEESPSLLLYIAVQESWEGLDTL